MAGAQVLADPVTSEADLARLDQQRIRLDTDSKVLQEKIQNKAGDQGDLQMRQQASIAKSVAKKKEDVLYKLEKLTDKRNVLRGHAGEVRPLVPVEGLPLRGEGVVRATVTCSEPQRGMHTGSLRR